MRVLLIKMSSMGDVFHTFPALTDAVQAIPDLKVDWVVEKSFAEIPAWHPVVDKVYEIELRKWRKHPFKYAKERKAFFAHLQQISYDLIIDAQGLLKSAWVINKLSAKKAGMDWQSAREPMASWFYDKKIRVEKDQHAILRLRKLFAESLNYPLLEQEQFEYALDTKSWQPLFDIKDYVVFLHGTTWQTKYWPEENWIALGKYLLQHNKQLVIAWGDGFEKDRATRIKEAILVDEQLQKNAKNYQVWVPEQKLTLNEMATCLKFAQGVVSVDTGLSHVAAALEVPMVVLYRVTDPKKVGALGKNVRHLMSPCADQYIKKFASTEQELQSLDHLSVENVIEVLKKQ